MESGRDVGRCGGLFYVVLRGYEGFCEKYGKLGWEHVSVNGRIQVTLAGWLHHCGF